jgi:hypothetical protein
MENSSTNDEAGETIPFVPLNALTAPIAAGAIPGNDGDRSATPFESPRLRAEAFDLSLFPLERYAEISGALAAGEPRMAVLNRYKLSPSLYDALASAWAARFLSEPALFARFTELARRSAASVKRNT